MKSLPGAELQPCLLTKPRLEGFGAEYGDYLRRVPMLVPFWPVRR